MVHARLTNFNVIMAGAFDYQMYVMGHVTVVMAVTMKIHVVSNYFVFVIAYSQIPQIQISATDLHFANDSYLDISNAN